jgi:hypothetical protein
MDNAKFEYKKSITPYESTESRNVVKELTSKIEVLEKAILNKN